MDRLRWVCMGLRHKALVLYAGIWLVGGIPLWRLLVHDLSKLFPPELGAYSAQKIRGCCSAERWNEAVHHHFQNNGHHWQHWIDGQSWETVKSGRISVMPKVFVREMVADYLASAREGTGKWDFSEWLEKNYHRMRLHPESDGLFRLILRQIGVKVAERQG